MEIVYVLSIFFIGAVLGAPTKNVTLYESIKKVCPKIDDANKIILNTFNSCKDLKLTEKQPTNTDLLCLLFYNSYSMYCSQTENTAVPELTPEIYTSYNLSTICDNVAILTDLPQTNQSNNLKLIDSKKCREMCKIDHLVFDVEPVCSLSYYYGHLVQRPVQLPQKPKDDPTSENAQVDPATIENKQQPELKLKNQSQTQLEQHNKLEGHKPELAKTKPQQGNKPELAKSKPQDQENKPELAKSKPQDQENKPELAKSKPQDQENKPELAKSKPQDQENKPNLEDSLAKQPNLEIKEHKTSTTNDKKTTVVDKLPDDNPVLETDAKPEIVTEKNEVVGKTEDLELNGGTIEQPVQTDFEIKGAQEQQLQQQQDDFNSEEDDDTDLVDDDLKIANKPKENNKPNTIDEAQAVDYTTEMEGDSYFFSYFMMLCLIFIVGYVCYHNKQKILALILEGRRGKRQYRSRRPNSANYHKLDSNLEEAITSSCNKNASNVIY